MIKPHGSNELNPLYVYNDAGRERLIAETITLPAIVIDSAAAANAVMLGSGYFNPLTGFMNLADCLSVSESMTMTNGLFWPTPVANRIESADGLSLGQKS